MKNEKIKVGLFGIGLDTYWPQFNGLKERLIGYQKIISEKLSKKNANVIDVGLIDSPIVAKETAHIFEKEQIDVLFIFISTYALSHTVLPVVQKLNCPVIILNLQPEKSIDYKSFNALNDRGKMTGEWLAYCQSCVAPEIVSVFKRSKISYHLISGYLEEAFVWQEVDEYLMAVKVKKAMANNRVGLLGHYYNGMLDVYSDLTQQAAVFANHFEILEFGLLKKNIEEVTESEIKEKIKDFHSFFKVNEECELHELKRAAKTSIALDKLVLNHQLGSIAYYYEGTGDTTYENIVTSLIPGLTLLTGRNIPVAGEYEVKNVQAMKIMDLMDCGGSFSEFYALDFDDDIVLFGHDGPAHYSIAEGQVSLVPLPVYHGKPGKGLSIQMKVATGKVTLLSVCQSAEGKIFFLVAEGVSEDGPTLQIGNTNSRYRFPLSVRDFVNNWSNAGPSHHCAIGLGHKASTLKKLASLLNIDFIQVC
jgi:L-arabinose isomerase